MTIHCEAIPLFFFLGSVQLSSFFNHSFPCLFPAQRGALTGLGRLWGPWHTALDHNESVRTGDSSSLVLDSPKVPWSITWCTDTTTLFRERQQAQHHSMYQRLNTARPVSGLCVVQTTCRPVPRLSSLHSCQWARDCQMMRIILRRLSYGTGESD